MRHEKSHDPGSLRGGVKLTLTKARELAMQEFGTARGLHRECGLTDYFETRFGNLHVRIAPDTYCGTGCIRLEARLNGYGCAYQMHDPETLERDFAAEEERLRQEQWEALEDWVDTNGPDACHQEVDEIWNRP